MSIDSLCVWEPCTWHWALLYSSSFMFISFHFHYIFCVFSVHFSQEGEQLDSLPSLLIINFECFWCLVYLMCLFPTCWGKPWQLIFLFILCSHVSESHVLPGDSFLLHLFFQMFELMCSMCLVMFQTLMIKSTWQLCPSPFIHSHSYSYSILWCLQALCPSITLIFTFFHSFSCLHSNDFDILSKIDTWI